MMGHKSMLWWTLNYKQKYAIEKVHLRYIQVTVVGAVTDIGKNVALLMKHNSCISRLQLYDDDERVHGVGLELVQIPEGPTVTSFSGDTFLPVALRYSQLVLMVSRTPRKLGQTREQMLCTNALPVQKVCKALSDQNPDAFFALSTNPINSIVPFASALLRNYNAYNKNKILGITHIDTARVRALISSTLNINPRHLHVPVIGGHSDDTIIPLFSNVLPSHYCIHPFQGESLTRLLKKSGTEVLNQKIARDAATLAVAWSINEFVDQLLEALRGAYVVVNCYTSNSNFGTKFFSGPTKIGEIGVIENCGNFVMNNYERSLLEQAVPLINRDIANGENHVHVIESARNLL